MASWTEDHSDLILGGDKPMNLAMGLEAPQDLLTPQPQYDPDRLCLAAQFIRDHNTRLSELVDQALQESAGGFRFAVFLYKDVQDVSFRINNPILPMLHTIDR